MQAHALDDVGPAPSRAQLPTGHVTFMITDVEGSTRLVLALGEAFAETVETHNTLVRRSVQAEGGTVVSTAGDGVFAVFPSARGAVRAAVSIQRALRDQDWPHRRPVRVRMGLHSGLGVLGGDDYLGLDVHRAARIGAVASGGQVLLSAATVAELGTDLPEGVQLRDLGEHLLKDLPSPERISQLLVADLPSDFPPLRSLRRPVLAPPTPATSFIPRPEVDQAGDLLATHRLLTLTGPGGTGKTRTALVVAAAVTDSFPDGVAFVDLAPITSAALVAPAVATAVGLPAGEGSVTERLLAHLRPMRLLLVLDNVEQVLDASVLVSDILAASSEVRVLATSRAPLRVAGEQELPLPPLALPTAADESDLGALLATPAVALFADRAAAVRPGFAITAANAHAVAEMVRRLDGLPLAVELAAARVRMLGPNEIAAALRSQGTRALGPGRRDAPERQRTLEAVVEWSYRLLDPSAATVFRWLSVFAGGATMTHLEQVVPSPGADLLDALESLVEHSLVRLDPSQSAARFTMLETIRQYARARLDEGGETEQAARRHALAFLDLAGQARPHLSDWEQTRWLDDLDRERVNLHVALAWCLDHDPMLSTDLALTLGHYWQVRGNRREGVYWLSRVISAAEESSAVPVDVVGDLRRRLAVLLDLAGEWQRACDVLEAELTSARERGDTHRLPSILNSLGITRRNCADRAGARVAFEEAAALRRELADEAGLASTLTNLAALAIDDGDLTLAAGLLTEVLALDERVGNTEGVALDHANLGFVHLHAGLDGPAGEHLAQALEAFAAVGDDAGTAYVLEGVAVLAARVGDHRSCAMLLGAGQRLRERAGEPMPDVDARSLEQLVLPARTGLGDSWDEEVSRGRIEPHSEAAARARRVLAAVG